jgi:hypothetical protein
MYGFTDFVTATGTGYARKISPSGSVTEYALPGSLSHPEDLASAAGIDGNLHVANRDTNKTD